MGNFFDILQSYNPWRQNRRDNHPQSRSSFQQAPDSTSVYPTNATTNPILTTSNEEGSSTDPDPSLSSSLTQNEGKMIIVPLNNMMPLIPLTKMIIMPLTKMVPLTKTVPLTNMMPLTKTVPLTSMTPLTKIVHMASSIIITIISIIQMLRMKVIKHC